MTELRLYTLGELGPDGYPPEWHRVIKHQVRHNAGHRCIRCHHPYRNGEHGTGEWSPCDRECTHAGPFRHQLDDEDLTRQEAETRLDELLALEIRQMELAV